jgi:hypothetical protein
MINKGERSFSNLKTDRELSQKHKAVKMQEGSKRLLADTIIPSMINQTSRNDAKPIKISYNTIINKSNTEGLRSILKEPKVRVSEPLDSFIHHD